VAAISLGLGGCAALQRNATLLVSGVNLHLPAADRLLRLFPFLPQARLDDVMVSWAGAGGGVHRRLPGACGLVGGAPVLGGRHR